MPRALVKTISWLPNSPLRLEEGPIVEAKIYAHKGWAGMRDSSKMRALRELAVTYGNDPRMRWFTASVLRRAHVDFRDYERVAATLLAWVQNNITYTNEPGEQIQAPWWTMRYLTGDCDDMAILLASMAQSVRLPWKFALGGRDRKGNAVRYIDGDKEPRGVNYSHIYLYLGWPPFKPTQWAAAEPTLRGAPLGYDVVLQGAGQMGQGNQGRSHQMPELSGTSAYGGGIQLFPQVDRKTRGELVRDLIIGIGVGVVTSVATTFVVEYIRERR